MSRKGPIELLHNAMGDGEVGGVTFPEIKHHKDVRFNVITVTRVWGVLNFQEKVLHKI